MIKSLIKKFSWRGYMSVIVIIGQSMHFFQSWKIFSTQSAEDVSMVSYLICLTLLLHWLGYGYLIKNKLSPEKNPFTNP